MEFRVSRFVWAAFQEFRLHPRWPDDVADAIWWRIGPAFGLLLDRTRLWRRTKCQNVTWSVRIIGHFRKTSCSNRNDRQSDWRQQWRRNALATMSLDRLLRLKWIAVPWLREWRYGPGHSSCRIRLQWKNMDSVNLCWVCLSLLSHTNETNSLIGQHQSASLKRPLSWDGITAHVCR